MTEEITGGPHDTRARLRACFSLRDEQPGDADAIAQLIEAAFRDAAHSGHTEHLIVDALRLHGQLTVSLVVLEGERIVGHVAVSPVRISSGVTGWYGLGPLSVSPERQRLGVGTVLAQAALDTLRRLGGLGCVVLGDPGYYGRFGFSAGSGLLLAGVPAAYFQALALLANVPVGEVRYHEAFEATGPARG